MRYITAVKLLGCLAAFAALSGSARAELIITGVFDGPLTGGEPKVVELYATGATDLSQYRPGAANNGGGSDSWENILTGTVPGGSYVYIIDDNDPAAGDFNSYFGFTPTYSFDSNLGLFGGAAAINGDDAVELFYDPTGLFAGGETVVDVFGDINVDGTGTAWDYLDGWAYRKNGTGPDGSTFVLDNWTFSGVDVNDGKTTNVEPNAFPIGTYVIPEPSSIALLGALALAGVGRRRRVSR